MFWEIIEQALHEGISIDIRHKAMMKLRTLHSNLVNEISHSLIGVLMVKVLD